ncbi:MAG: rRNA maturation RNase YbeY [Planctomycetota bacterium]|jgi:probable rRNA maturation factor
MPEPRFSINDRRDPPSDPAFIARVLRAALAYVDRPDLEVSLLLSDEREISDLHGKYLNDPSPTDVITFSLDEASVEIAVSVERAEREALERGHAMQAELALYIVHGVLHACGYDDVEAEDRHRMRAAERDVLAELGFEIESVDED